MCHDTYDIKRGSVYYCTPQEHCWLAGTFASHLAEQAVCQVLSLSDLSLWVVIHTPPIHVLITLLPALGRSLTPLWTPQQNILDMHPALTWLQIKREISHQLYKTLTSSSQGTTHRAY